MTLEQKVNYLIDKSAEVSRNYPELCGLWLRLVDLYEHCESFNMTSFLFLRSLESEINTQYIKAKNLKIEDKPKSVVDECLIDMPSRADKE